MVRCLAADHAHGAPRSVYSDEQVRAGLRSHAWSTTRTRAAAVAAARLTLTARSRRAWPLACASLSPRWRRRRCRPRAGRGRRRPLARGGARAGGPGRGAAAAAVVDAPTGRSALGNVTRPTCRVGARPMGGAAVHQLGPGDGPLPGPGERGADDGRPRHRPRSPLSAVACPSLTPRRCAQGRLVVMQERGPRLVPRCRGARTRHGPHPKIKGWDHGGPKGPISCVKRGTTQGPRWWS